jgi:hypothetical protein
MFRDILKLPVQRPLFYLVLGNHIERDINPAFIANLGIVPPVGCMEGDSATITENLFHS